MRRLLYLSVLCTLFFISCKKENGSHPSTGTLGRWQWDHSFGGFGATRYNPSANTTVSLVLFENNTYRIEKNGQVAVTDSFQARATNGEESILFKNLVTVDKLTMYSETGAKIENGQLVLTDNLSDGFQHYFKK